MKTLSLDLKCDAPGCTTTGSWPGPSALEAKARANVAGWRLGAVRDICPDCLTKGHRP